MRSVGVAAFTTTFILFLAISTMAQQAYKLPDVRSLKHLTTQNADRARDIPGKETTMDFYDAGNGQVITVYSYLGRKFAFSTHSNSDIQNTYRTFIDMEGRGLFQEINRGTQWEIPTWVRR